MVAALTTCLAGSPQEVTDSRENAAAPPKLRLAAAGDIHCHEGLGEQLRASFAEMDRSADLILLAGDLTSTGEPSEASVLAEALRPLSTPVVAVLGNHDCHRNGEQEITTILRDAAALVLERESAILEVAGQQVGIVGLKGFVGGFAPSNLPDFGESLLRTVYAETGKDVAALERGLSDIAACPFRIVLLHYSPTPQTLQGEPPEIWVFLGTDRLAAPLEEQTPDLVLHGHAHAGQLEGAIGAVPVYNVSVPVLGRDHWSIELSAAPRPVSPIP